MLSGFELGDARLKRPISLALVTDRLADAFEQDTALALDLTGDDRDRPCLPILRSLLIELARRQGLFPLALGFKFDLLATPALQRVFDGREPPEPPQVSGRAYRDVLVDAANRLAVVEIVLTVADMATPSPTPLAQDRRSPHCASPGVPQRP